MKIPRIKLPDKNLISLREFISGWRVNYHSTGLGRFKLNLGKTTTFPRSTLRHICQIHSRWKTNKASPRDLFAVQTEAVRLRLVGDVYRGRHWDMAAVLPGDTDPGYWWQTSSQLTARLAWWCQLAVSPAPHLSSPLHPKSEDQRQTGRQTATNVPTVTKNIKGIYHGH